MDHLFLIQCYKKEETQTKLTEFVLDSSMLSKLFVLEVQIRIDLVLLNKTNCFSKACIPQIFSPSAILLQR